MQRAEGGLGQAVRRVLNAPALPRVLMVLSMIVFGTISVFVRMIPLPSAEIALYRAVLATVVISIVALVGRFPMNRSVIRRALPVLIASGGLMGFNWILIFEAYRYTTVSITTLAVYMAPVIVVALSPLVLKERLRPFQVFCFVMAVVGFVLIVGVDTTASSNHGLGIALGLGAAAMYACVVLLNKRSLGVHVIHRTLLQFVAAAVLLAIYVAMTGGFHLSNLDLPGTVSMLVLGIVHSGITYCLYFYALSRLRAQEIGILSFIDPLVAVLISALFFREPFGPLQMLGAAIILVFAWLSESRGPSARRIRNNNA